MDLKEYAENAENKKEKTIIDIIAIELNKIINKKGEKKNDK